jgi:hypothetical protein
MLPVSCHFFHVPADSVLLQNMQPCQGYDACGCSRTFAQVMVHTGLTYLCRFYYDQAATKYGNLRSCGSGKDGGGCLFFYIQSFVYAARKGYCLSSWDLKLLNIKLV